MLFRSPLRSLCALLNDDLLVDAEGSVFYSVKQYNVPDHERFRFRKLEIPPKVEASSGSANFLLLDEKRQLWKHETTDSEAMVTEWLEKVDSFVSGGYHFMVHLLDGRTMMYGNNSWGQFGPGCPDDFQDTPILCAYQKASSSRQKSARFVADQSNKESLPATTGKRSDRPAPDEDLPRNKK